jgi:glycine dehydrogenase subunit 1
MLAAIGVNRFEDLLAGVPDEIRLKQPLRLPEGLSETEVDALLPSLAAETAAGAGVVSFLGGGVYDQYIPAALDHVGGRSEFYTAYTPYQAEVAQGTLQATYEFQSMICRLTGLEVAQASVYDGGSGIAEAALLAIGQTRRRTVVLAGTLNPRYRSVLETYLMAQGVTFKTAVSASTGTTDLNELRALMDDDVACVIMPSPNYFGVLERWDTGAELAHQHGALFIAVFRPLALGVIRSPGECGADVAVGEGQCLGNAPSFGGPLLGLFAARREYIRRLPGRLVGRTVDVNGNTAYVMTLQTREQHIRREKATSNICTAQALLATRAAIYMALLGKEGFAQLAKTCMDRAHSLASRIDALPGYSVPFGPAFFNEFVVEAPVAARQVLHELRRQGILGGIDLGGRFPDYDNRFLVCVSERRTPDVLDRYVKGLQHAAAGSRGADDKQAALARHQPSSMGSDS